MLALFYMAEYNPKDHITFIVSEFVQTTVGSPFRLFPFGKIVKNGNEHEITPDTAKLFKLPHFKPPIKLGSHDEPTPAGGHIVALLVKEDGLYAVPEWNEAGLKAMQDGAYRYHSPEVVWDEGAIEHPQSGALMQGPFIMGDALLHEPHLGEAAKLYSVTMHENDGEKGVMKMSDETIQVPKTWFDGVVDFIKRDGPKEEEPMPITETDEYKAAVEQRDNLQAELDQLKADEAQKGLLGSLTADLQDQEKFGMAFIELETASEAADMLSGMSEDQREWVLRHFKAFIAQINESELTGEEGSDQENTTSDDPAEAFDAAVRAISVEDKVDYNTALQKAIKDHPELYTAYQNSGKAKESE